MLTWAVGAFCLALAATRLPVAGMALVHVALALVTCAVWRAKGASVLAARRAGWLALAIPFTGALAAACLGAGRRGTWRSRSSPWGRPC